MIDITARVMCAVLAVLLAALVVGGVFWLVKLQAQIKDLYEAVDILTEFMPKKSSRWRL